MNYNDLKWTYSLSLNNESEIVQRISYCIEFHLFGAITRKLTKSMPNMLSVTQFHDMVLPTIYVETPNTTRLS